MMPGSPGEADYDDPAWDRFWAAAAELGLPISFHILTTSTARTRGSRLNSFLAIVRGIQDIMSLLVFGGVFERHPDLRVVCVEADAGWVPHFMYRMDHAYKRHRHHLRAGRVAGHSCPRSTSPSTSTSRSRTTGRRSASPTT